MDTSIDLSRYPLEAIAKKVGTPYYLYDGAILRERMAELARTAGPDGGREPLHARYAMKANSLRYVLDIARDAGLWIDAVSGNEVQRARRAGFAGGHEQPVIMYTADVFRDDALQTVVAEGVLPNVGSPGMIRDLHDAGYAGPIALRVNPGFGHGHVQACDTGGPSSKHGIWHEQVGDAREAAKKAGYPVVALHAHVGTGPQISEFDTNMRRLRRCLRRIAAGVPGCPIGEPRRRHPPRLQGRRAALRHGWLPNAHARGGDDVERVGREADCAGD